jgi:hypothetical protein
VSNTQKTHGAFFGKIEQSEPCIKPTGITLNSRQGYPKSVRRTWKDAEADIYSFLTMQVERVVSMTSYIQDRKVSLNAVIGVG